jgi:hypothetical protein
MFPLKGEGGICWLTGYHPFLFHAVASSKEAFKKISTQFVKINERFWMILSLFND